MHRRIAVVAAFVVAVVVATPLAAQQRQVEGHATYSRSTVTHANSWGAGAQLGFTFGDQQQPVQLTVSPGVDYLKQENGGPGTYTATVDGTLQPGGDVTPYAGGSVSENWMSGGGAPIGAHVGLQWLAGVQVKLEPQGPISLRGEVRDGYLKTQEHALAFRLGVSSTF